MRSHPVQRLRAIAPYVVVLALAAFLFHLASGFTYAQSGNRLGPGVWPRAILVLMMVACAFRIVRLLLVAPAVLAHDMPAAAPSDGADGEPVVPLSPVRLALGVGLTVAYVALLPVLGFALATAIYIAAMCRVGDYRRWHVILPTAIVGSLAFMFVFQRIVYVSLPIGTPPFDTIALGLMRLMGIR